MASDDRDASLAGVRGRSEGVRGGHFEGQVEPAHRGQIDREAQQIRTVGQRRETPGQYQWKMEVVGRIDVIGQTEQRVFEGEQGPGIDVEGQMQIDGTTATIYGVQIDLPGLTQGVGLHEVSLVVNMEAVIDGVILQVGNEAGDVDGGHCETVYSGDCTVNS